MAENFNIVKRNGTKETFSIDKVKSAIRRAFMESKEEINEHILDSIVEQINFYDYMNVEDIQNQVEVALMKDKYYQVAKNYVIYREKHKQLRKQADDNIKFIKSFVKSDNAANATIDDNSNVTCKNIGVLNAEIHKRDNKNTNMTLWEDKVKEMFPDMSRKQMRNDFRTILYPHDASSQVLMPYCMAVSMYPFLLNGLRDLGGKSAVPKNLDSFCGIYTNLVFALASEVKGAVATPEVLMYFDHFARKEWGDDYYTNESMPITSPSCKRQKTIGSQIDQYFQQITYSINQVAGSRGMQSPFTNFSFFDKFFFDGMFGEFVFPDGDKPKWESVNWIQKRYLHWLNQERLKEMLTFPVCSYACLVDKEGNYKDNDTYEFIAKEYSEGNSFFTYLSDSVDSLSSCCFSKDTKVLWKSSTLGVQCTTLEELHNTKWEPDKKNLRIFHNGSWVKGKSIKLPNRKMFKISTSNNKEFYMTDNHINVTYDGEKPTDKLTTEDYILFNTATLDAVPENDENLTYEQGYTVGAFLGDGSFSKNSRNGIIYCTNYSLNESKYYSSVDIINKANLQCGSETQCSLGKIYNNVYPVTISSKKLVAFIQRWTNWTEGTRAYNKELNLNCLLQSYDFRKGILDGWYATDGGNSNRCYTSSEKLKDCMEILITSLGMNSIIDKSDRTDEVGCIRGEMFNHNYPIWCVRWYDSANKRTMDGVFKKKNNGVYFKIKNIEEVEYKDDVYCIECNNQDEPYFTSPNGAILHNCRLQNSIKDNTFSFTNGQIGVMTGSKQVITLDLNRIIQDIVNQNVISRDFGNWSAEEYDIFNVDITTILDRVYKYHKAYNSLLHWAKDNHLYGAYDAGFINLDKQYLTIGINGLNQAAEFLGIECNNNEKYKRFCELIFGTIKEQNSLHKTKTEMFNCEQVPAESAAIKLYNRDKEDGYWTPEDTNLYASYIFKPNDKFISILDKITLHSSKFAADKLDGGSAAHLNLSNHLSVSQYKKILSFAAKQGCKYFTFNIPNSQCDDCGFITKHPIGVCPKCGSKHIVLWDRIIGYLTPLKSWSEGRKIEQSKRVYSENID